MENLLITQAAAVQETQQAAAYKKKQQSCLLTGLAGSSKPVFFAALDKLLGGKGSLCFITASREEIRAYEKEAYRYYNKKRHQHKSQSFQHIFEHIHNVFLPIIHKLLCGDFAA